MRSFGHSSPFRRPVRRYAARLSLPVYLILLTVLALWPFDFERRCNQCENDAIVGPPIDGIHFAGPGYVSDREGALPLIERLIASGALTVVAVVTPDSFWQDGPARIVTLSDGPNARNFTLGQERGDLVFRLRTPSTGRNGATPRIAAPGVFAAGHSVEVAASFDGRTVHLFADGVLRASRNLADGSFAGWDRDHQLVFGNETSGERPWRGTLHDVTIFDRALDLGAFEQSAKKDGRASDAPAYRLAERCLDQPVSYEKSGWRSGACRAPRRYANAHDWTALSTQVPREWSDKILNAALWCPVGMFLIWALSAARPHRTAAAVFSAICLATALEAAQSHLMFRTSSITDLIAAIIGIALGSGFAWVFSPTNKFYMPRL